MDLRAAIQTIIKPLLNPFERVIIPCTVVGSYDASTNTIKVKSNLADGLEIDALLSGDDTGAYGIVVVPEANSLVWVVRPPLLGGGVYYIDKVTTVAKVLAKLGNSTLEWDAANGILTLNNGTKKGVPMAPALVGRLNAIETKVNALSAVYNAHTHVVVSVGAPTATPVAPDGSAPLTPTQLNDIANPDIKQ